MSGMDPDPSPPIAPSIRLSPEQWATLAHAVLDGTASDAQAARVGAEIAADPERARDLARLAMLHDGIERALDAGAEGRAAALAGADRRSRGLRPRAVVRRLALAAAMLALVVGGVRFALGTDRTASAAEVLARIVEVARRGDRTYVLRAVGGEARAAVPRRNGRPQPMIDWAVLHVRAPASYVLSRLDGAGGEVLTGSDGRVAWMVPARGPVRVSRDPRRFSGALPGSQHGITFIDPHGDLSQLAASYELRLESGGGSMPIAKLIGVRRDPARGGPKSIEIIYDPDTAVIQAIRLGNLPQARGGPRSVEFELVDDSSLAELFFTPGFHHEADRHVIQED
jgi:anti-sigma factor RsiW